MTDVEERPAFEDVARELAAPILRYLERYTGDRAVAEDLLQETLMRMHRGLPSFAARSSLKTWSFAIASRVAADHFRRRDSLARCVVLDEIAEPIDSDAAIEERMVVDEMNACVRSVIDSLPEVYRAALVLHDLEGLSAEQTAEVCACSLATAKIRIHRARLRLRQALDAQCDYYRDADSVLRCDRKPEACA